MGTLNGEQEGMTGKNTESKFVNVLGGAAVIACFLVCFFYVVNFSGGISSSTTRWSEFGGYLSGVLLPVISFLTLAAILRTIYLQREMIKLQDQTFRSQIAQADLLATDAMQSRLDYRKSVLMGIIDKVGGAITNEINSTQKGCYEAIKVMNSMTDTAQVQNLSDGVQKLQRQIENLDSMRLALQRLMFSLSMKTYSSIDELDKEFRERMGMIRPDFGEAPH